MASLRELYTKLDLLPKVIDDVTNLAYESVLQQRYEQDLDNSPHGHPWHTSFHASQFPPRTEFACPRQAVYQMANFAKDGPVSRWLVGLGDVGKGIENSLTKVWHEYGILLSPPPTAPIQLGAQDNEHWLTCSFDSVLQLPGTNRPVPVEVKSKALDKVREMIMGQRGPDDQHVAQLKVQLYFLYKNQKKWWPELDNVEFGVIYYLSRDDPSVTKEFNIPLDIPWVEERIEIIDGWKEAFQNEEIPQTQTKSHPLGFKWSEPPCKWCPFKKHICKPDWKDGITDLDSSNGIKYTKAQRESYNYGEEREKVLKRWNVN